ncbi:hypothetical protein BIV60_26835 [Bacillus sp. MUM 116]|nr:hypothetical protein BIV60_26835 [Bacillus sp. MUM 116]
MLNSIAVFYCFVKKILRCKNIFTKLSYLNQPLFLDANIFKRGNRENTAVYPSFYKISSNIAEKRESGIKIAFTKLRIILLKNRNFLID